MVRDKDTGSENAGIEQTKFGENGEFEFPTGKYRETLKPDKQSEAEIHVESVEVINTKFGQRILICGRGQCIFGNKIIFTKLATYGIKKPSDLIGKTLHLKSIEVYVMGIPKKTWKLEGVE